MEDDLNQMSLESISSALDQNDLARARTLIGKIASSSKSQVPRFQELCLQLYAMNPTSEEIQTTVAYGLWETDVVGDVNELTDQILPLLENGSGSARWYIADLLNGSRHLHLTPIQSNRLRRVADSEKSDDLKSLLEELLSRT